MPGAGASGSGSVGLCLPLLVESSCVVFRESSNLSRNSSLKGLCMSLWALLPTELSPACFSGQFVGHRDAPKGLRQHTG